jgi:hypothetical protein
MQKGTADRRPPAKAFCLVDGNYTISFLRIIPAAPRMPVPNNSMLDGLGTGDASEDTTTDPAVVVSLKTVKVESKRISFEIVKELVPDVRAVKSKRTNEPFPEIPGIALKSESVLNAIVPATGSTVPGMKRIAPVSERKLSSATLLN